MIDLTNKPEGVTHAFNGDYYKIKGKVAYIWRDGWYCSQTSYNNIKLMPVSKDDDWTIYNNDKPLSELPYEQAAELFNYCRNGGEVEILSGDDVWLLVVNSYHMIIADTYRAKQKSKRELFIEAVNEALSDTALMPLPYAEMLFVSGKFKFFKETK